MPAFSELVFGLVSPGTYVEVSHGLPGIDCASDHLHELVRRDSVTHSREQQSRERRDERADDERENVRPPWQRGLPLEYDDQACRWTSQSADEPQSYAWIERRTREEGESQEDDVPPPRHFLVVLVQNLQRIVVSVT